MITAYKSTSESFGAASLTSGRLGLAQGQREFVVSLLLLAQLLLPLPLRGPRVRRVIVVVGGGSGGGGGRGQAGERVLDVERVLVPVVPERIFGELEAGVAALGTGRGRRCRARRRRAAAAAARVTVIVVVDAVGMPRNAIAAIVVVVDADAGELRRISR